VKHALGPDPLSQLGSQTGMAPDQLSQGLAQMLPDLVNQMTPDGQVPADDKNVIEDRLAALLKG
jgi:uncharacterized protein YidB (DUF937 family)